MKKLILATALVMGIGTSVFAANANSNDTTSISISAQVNEFIPIEVKDLPQAIQDVLTKNYANQSVKEAAVETKEDGSKLYKVTLVSEDGTEKAVIFNEKGEIV